jgi:hypothetical protein
VRLLLAALAAALLSTGCATPTTRACHSEALAQAKAQNLPGTSFGGSLLPTPLTFPETERKRLAMYHACVAARDAT